MGTKPWGRAGCWLLLLVFWVGCASGPTVRLRTERGTRTYAPATWDRRVPVSAREFEDALTRLVLEAPLTVRAACGALKAATDRAQTFQELEEAAEVFAQALGPEVARVFVLAVTVLVSHGVTVGLSSALSLMPRFPDAVRLGSAQAGFNPARVLDVSAVAVVDGVVEVTLASTAVAMAAMGPPPASSAGGPGKWVQVNESMSDRARDYRTRNTSGWPRRCTGFSKRPVYCAPCDDSARNTSAAPG
ncbi:putative lipoprotein [Corallococcus coralloides]|uniref:Putative lipoprotein n=1 Tax=Corallococcus coralloides TaxID=184914 RepID=A0A410RJ45_CORCK|nr:hypothetical protein [Corallococcus coralloides]QAT81838.1 putative lipoprotein [Corallococcus coralloides]